MLEGDKLVALRRDVRNLYRRVLDFLFDHNEEVKIEREKKKKRAGKEEKRMKMEYEKEVGQDNVALQVWGPSRLLFLRAEK